MWIESRARIAIATHRICDTIANKMPATLEQSRTHFSTASPLTAKKLCSGCGGELPLEEFRPKRRIEGIVVGRHADCAACHRKTMRRRRAKEKSKGVRRFVSVTSREESYERMSALVNATVHRFGGIKKLSKAFIEEMELARETDSPVRARCILSLFNMLEMVEKSRPPKPSLNQISDEELIMRIVAEAMKERPEMVVAIGEALDWTLSPPVGPEPQDSIEPELV
jgi:hypothetical protein